jgi:hypothetical protein
MIWNVSLATFKGAVCTQFFNHCSYLIEAYFLFYHLGSLRDKRIQRGETLDGCLGWRTRYLVPRVFHPDGDGEPAVGKPSVRRGS